MNLEQMQEYLSKHNYTSRACRFKVIEDITGIDPETAKTIETINRYVRMLLPKDEVGAKKEQEWKRRPALAQAESDWDRIFRRTTA